MTLKSSFLEVIATYGDCDKAIVLKPANPTPAMTRHHLPIYQMLAAHLIGGQKAHERLARESNKGARCLVPQSGDAVDHRIWREALCSNSNRISTLRD